MRLTVILLVFALHVSAGGYAQTVTLHKKNALLSDIFKEIRQQTGYDFFYQLSWLEKAKRVSINVIKAPLTDALDLCFIDQPLSYKVTGTTIVLQLKSEIHTVANIINADGDVRGIVMDDNGAPLQEVNVMLKGTNKGTSTNIRGEFLLSNVETNAVLVITSIGYDKQEIAVSNKTHLRVQLKVAVNSLDEIQFIAYGTTSKRLSTGNVASVKAKDIEKQPVQNPLLALQGRVPGLFVIQSSGLAGSNVQIRIQGQNSIANGSEPLYVVDGVPIDPQLPRTGLDFVLANSGASFSGWGNPLNYLNPSDIESIDILKDADATAIYGSRAANGAILITTKKGKAGAMKLDLNMQTGWGQMVRRVDMMNTRQYLDMRYEAFANDGINWRDPSVSANDLKVWDTTSYTNWQDRLLGGSAHYTNLNASVSGGSANMRYLVSGTYHKETTVFPLPDEFANKKASVHFNINANSNNQKLKMQFSGSYMADDNRLPRFDLTQTAILLEPHAPPLLNADGSINWAPDANGNTTFGVDGNVMIRRFQKYVNKTYNLVSSLVLDYTVLPGLKLSSSFGFNYMQTDDYSPSPLVAVAPELRANTLRAAAFGDRNIKSWIIEPQVSYSTKINKGKLEVLAGSTFQDKRANAGYIYGTGQLSDELLDNISAAANIFNGGASTTAIYRYNALFGRINYNWKDRYIINFNARRDGSTRFGAENRFHNFGSVGAAWIFSNEKFIQQHLPFLSFGKLRGSYGTIGSDQIGDYQFMSLYNVFSTTSPYQGIIGLFPAGLPNPNLEWEETRKLQIGLDVGFLQDRIIINSTYVRNRSSNQLLRYELPTTAGLSSYLTNFPAVIQNRNWEFSINGKLIQKQHFNWIVNANLTIPQNKLLSFPNLATSTYANILVVGEPLDATGSFHWIGVGEGTGDYLYANKDGHSTLTPNLLLDRTRLISLYPKFYGGFQNSITYKSIQIDFLFQFVKQTGYNDFAFWNGSRYPGMFARGNSNQPVTVLDRWRKPSDKAPVAKYSTANMPNIIDSDRRLADASHISLRNLSLSWDLPRRWIDKMKCRNFRLYLHGQNLLTITGYKGLNPETQSLVSLPPLRIWTFGVQAGF